MPCLLANVGYLKTPATTATGRPARIAGDSYLHLFELNTGDGRIVSNASISICSATYIERFAVPPLLLLLLLLIVQPAKWYSPMLVDVQIE